MRSIFSLFLITLFFSQGVFAQDAAEEKKKASRGVRFTCMAIAPGTPEILKIKTRRGIEDLSLSIRFASERLPLEPGGAIVIGTPSTDPKKEGINPLVLGNLPEGMTNAIAMLVPKPKAADGLCYNMVFVDEADIRGGDILFMNATKHPAQAKVDDAPLQLESGKPLFFHPSGLTAARNARVEIAVQYENKWQIITGSTWRLIPTRTEVCVVYWNVERNQPALKGITLIPEKGKS